MKAATYVRESTRAQEEGFCPDAQRQALAQYAAQQGIEIVATYEDFESGTKETREGFQQMLEAAQAHEFDAILCFHTSRFARDAEVARRAKLQLRNLGVKVIALNLPDLDPESRFQHELGHLTNEQYLEKRSAILSQLAASPPVPPTASSAADPTHARRDRRPVAGDGSRGAEGPVPVAPQGDHREGRRDHGEPAATQLTGLLDGLGHVPRNVPEQESFLPQRRHDQVSLNLSGDALNESNRN